MIARARSIINRNHEGARSQDPILVQQGVDYDPEEERHDDGDEEDGFERVPGALGTRLATTVAVAPPDLAAAVLAGRRVTAGLRYRRGDAAARRGHPHLAQLRHCLAGGVAVHLRRRRPLRRRLESRRRIHVAYVSMFPDTMIVLVHTIASRGCGP